MMDKQISKKKLERMAITGGDFKRAGQRSNSKDLSLDTLRTLLADDVDMASRVVSDRGLLDHDSLTSEDPQISDFELGLILDRRKVFHPTDPIRAEGNMYDIVNDSNVQPGSGLLSNLS